MTLLLPDEETKDKREIEYVVSTALSVRLDCYLQVFQPVFLAVRAMTNSGPP
jgi:hypothetical protein